MIPDYYSKDHRLYLINVVWQNGLLGGAMCYLLRLILFFMVIIFPFAVFANSYPAQVSVCFTPGQDCESEVLAFIYSAKQRIRVQAYSFTLYKIAHALVAMKNRGVDVQVIMDKSQFQCGQFSQAAYLIQNGIPVFNDNNLNIAHNKIIIVDGERVETGSFNYTSSAEHYNAENLVFLDNRDIANQYIKNWQWRQSQSSVASTECSNTSRSVIGKLIGFRF